MAGKDFPTMLASGAKADLTNPGMAVIENVRGLPEHILAESYGSKFAITYTQQCPADVGFEFMSRPRLVIAKDVAWFNNFVLNQKLWYLQLGYEFIFAL